MASSSVLPKRIIKVRVISGSYARMAWAKRSPYARWGEMLLALGDGCTEGGRKGAGEKGGEPDIRLRRHILNVLLGAIFVHVCRDSHLLCPAIAHVRTPSRYRPNRKHSV